MGETCADHHIKESLVQLSCHFTWDLVIPDKDIPDLENRIWEQIEFLDTTYSVGIHNLQAYVKHLRGQHEEALRCLEEAEDLIQGEQADQWEGRSLVTWGNYAWVHFHRGQLKEAQTYLDKVGNICEKLGSPFRYRVECPEMDCEEGWALLKCGGQYYRRALGCFAKAVEAEPENPEFSKGYAIIAYRQDQNSKSISLEPLQKAVRLNPENAYLKVLLALKLQDVGRGLEGTDYVEEALSSTSSEIYIFRYAAKFYRKKGCIDKALQLLQRSLQVTPDSGYLHYQIGLCYKAKMIQTKRATNRRPREQDEMVQQAIREFQKTLQLRPSFDAAYVCLAEMQAEIGHFEEAEENFQKVLGMENLTESTKQDIHLRYGNFQQFHRKSEDKAITHYLKGLKIEERTFFRGNLLKALEKVARRRISQNVHLVESMSLLGLVHKLKGEVKEALGCYEKALRLTEELNPAF